jgi:diguanylate cyclase (GGDEF)-like protein
VVNRLITVDVLGHLGLVRSAPRSATLVAREPVALLQVNWKMIQRLQWLYPPIAHKFMHNLLTIICDRLERLTDCLVDAKVFDDSTGLCNRESFLRHADTEIRRSRRYGMPMSLCLVEFDMASANPYLDSEQKETLLHRVSDFFVHNLRSCDIMGRCDLHRFGIIAPQTPAEQAWTLCERLKQLLLSRRWATGGVRLKVFCGVVELSPDAEETAVELLTRAAEDLNSNRLRQAGQKDA